MQVVRVIPYKTFKDKLKIVKKYDGVAKIEIFNKYVYIEQTEVEIWED